jgi:hypothetical protein
MDGDRRRQGYESQVAGPYAICQAERSSLARRALLVLNISPRRRAASAEANETGDSRVAQQVVRADASCAFAKDPAMFALMKVAQTDS